MDNHKSELLETLETVSEFAGTLAGKAATIGGEIADLASGSVSAGKEMLGLADKKVKHASEKKPDNTRISTLKSDLAAARRKLAKAEKTQSRLESQLKELKTENHSLASELEQMRGELSETKSREGVVRARAAALESELATTRQELAEMQNQAEHTQTQLNKQLQDLQAENKSLISELDQARKEADDERTRADVPAAEEIKLSVEADVTQEEPISPDVENVEEPELELRLESETEVDVEETGPEPMPEVEATEPAEVTAEDVQAADFTNAADRIIFARALSDFAGADTFARVDAARAIAGIDHKLSVKILVAHIADEPSAVVRRECIRALTTLEMAEGLSAVESALTDETASVRLAAVWGVYRLAGVESLPKLLGMLSDRDEGVRRRAVTCIGWLGGQIETIGGSQLRRVISALFERLDDSADSIRKAALDTLQAVAGKRMAEPISAGRVPHKHLIEQWRNWWKAELLG